MAQSAPILGIRYFFVDLIGGIALFPVWWYTRGLKKTTESAIGSVRNASAYFALGIWVKNLFVPMYGETSWQGRLISFFIRFWMIVFRGIAVGIWAALVAVLWIFYIAILPLSIFGLLFHGGGTLFGL
jgi:hypothetical protein